MPLAVFRGRLMAGGRLQLQALHQGTADLPTLKHLETADPIWATHTTEAMASGVARGWPRRLRRLSTTGPSRSGLAAVAHRW